MDSIKEKLVNLLIEKNYYISFAESVTGGLLASSIVDVASASKVLAESYVTYSNEVKEKLLNVKKDTIDKYDVVSEEVVKEMVLGLNLMTSSNICVATSGVAGPSGGTILIPVGTICIGYFINGKVTTEKCVFKGSRNEIRQECVNYIFNKLITLIGD